MKVTKKSAPYIIRPFALFLLFSPLHTPEAQSQQDAKTAIFAKAFTRHVTHHDKEHRQCIHTENLAQEHLALWQQWNKTHHWPEIRLRTPTLDKSENVQPPKSGATSVVRISMYLYGDQTKEIEADNSGRVATYGARYDMGPYEYRAFYLKPQQMDDIHALLRKIPPSRKVVTWSDILLISGRSNGRWILRMYSRTHQSRAVRDLLQILNHNQK